MYGWTKHLYVKVPLVNVSKLVH